MNNNLAKIASEKHAYSPCLPSYLFLVSSSGENKMTDAKKVDIARKEAEFIYGFHANHGKAI